jgi:hypothetical protein
MNCPERLHCRFWYSGQRSGSQTPPLVEGAVIKLATERKLLTNL